MTWTFLLILLTGFTSFLFMFPIYEKALSLCMVFDAIASNIDIDEVLSINPCPVFVSGGFNVHHKDWLTYSGGTDRPVCSVIFLYLD